MLERIAEDVWIADGPKVTFVGLPFPTRMAIARLPSGALWVWSPIALDDALAAEVDALGDVRVVVEPNKLHHLALRAWKKRWPGARGLAPPGLAHRFDDLHFEGELGDAVEPAFEGVIEHVIVRGSFALEEVLYFHRPSSTLFVGDLVQRHDPATLHGWRRTVMKLDGIVGPNGSTPREWRASFLRRSAARSAVRRAIDWAPTRVVLAHGLWARENGAELLRSAFSWLSVG